MLGKILKYDLKWIYKVIVIFYISSIIFALLTRIFLSIENSLLFNFLGNIANWAMIAMVICSLINGFIRSWARFINNIYKDESYLTHTLPIEKKSIFLSKVIMAILCSFTSILVTLLCLFITYYSKENMDTIKEYLKITADTYNVTIWGLILIFAFVVFLEMLFIILIGYVGIILGYKTNTKKTLYSIIIGAGLYYLTSIITIVLIVLIGLFNKDVMNLVVTKDSINITTLKNILLFGVCTYVLYNIIYYLIGKKQLEKGVNVD